MQTVRQHQEVIAGLIHEKIRDWEIDKYTYLRGKFTAESNIYDGPFPQKYSMSISL